ncbi:MAG: YdeI/OmpD-associated family protein [Actinomycetota bacterium]
MSVPDLERVEVSSAAELWAWLGEHHARPASVLLITFRSAHPESYVSRDEVLDALVAHGWVDGRRFALDDARTMQLIGPRQQHRWAASYVERYRRLASDGQLHPSGRAAFESAVAAGVIDELSHVDRLEVPSGLADELARRDATTWWDSSAPSYRRNVLRWLATAKRPATRAGRVSTIAEHAARGEKVPNY